MAKGTLSTDRLETDRHDALPVEIRIPNMTKSDLIAQIRKMTLMDDTFMTKVFEDPACAEHLLHVILERDDLTVIEAKSQYPLKNLQGRSVRLDIYAVDQEGNRYDIEVQRDNTGAIPRRARYNLAMIDADMTDAGDDFHKLRETYVIFITESDVLGGGLPIYHADRVIRETNQPLDDGTHIIYVNASIQDDTPLGRLMQDMQNPDPNTLHSPVLADRSKYFKETREGAEHMCKIVQDLCNRSAAYAAAEATMRANKQFVHALWQNGTHNIEQIAHLTQLTVEEVQKILSDNNITPTH